MWGQQVVADKVLSQQQQTNAHFESHGCTLNPGRESPSQIRLAGLVVKTPASRAEDPGFESRLRRDFFEVVSYQ